MENRKAEILTTTDIKKTKGKTFRWKRVLVSPRLSADRESLCSSRWLQKRFRCLHLRIHGRSGSNSVFFRTRLRKCAPKKLMQKFPLRMDSGPGFYVAKSWRRSGLGSVGCNVHGSDCTIKVAFPSSCIRLPNTIDLPKTDPGPPDTFYPLLIAHTQPCLLGTSIFAGTVQGQETHQSISSVWNHPAGVCTLRHLFQRNSTHN